MAMSKTMTTEDIAAGFATALSKLFGPEALVDLMEHATDGPPKEPCVIKVGTAYFDAETHLLHRSGDKLCLTPRIHGCCVWCRCGAVIWDDR